MSLNKTKCKVMSFTRNVKIHTFDYQLENDVIDHTSSYKYLGVHLTCDLSWKTHIHSVIANANRTLGYLRRNLKLAPKKVKLIAYNTFVRSKLEYASAIWSPWQCYLTNELEAIQNRAIRFICNNFSRFSSISQMRLTLGMDTLSNRRKISRLCLLHKIYYNNPSLRACLLKTPHRVSARTSHTCTIRAFNSSSVTFSNSTLPSAITDWNTLPNSIVTITDYNKFKSELMSYVFETSI